MWDRDRELVFTGTRLGGASSFVEGKQRWTEVEIYVTTAGSYVVSGVGQTNVRRGDLVWDDRAGIEVQADRDEEPIRWVHVSETAEGAVESLYQEDAASTRYLTKVARQALREAAGRDDSLRRAFFVEEVA